MVSTRLEPAQDVDAFVEHAADLAALAGAAPAITAL
jgi:hypothetical protein